MRIAQVAPLYLPVPPEHYGGIERIVSYLTEELVAQGHEVSLFASGDSQTRAKLVPCAPHAIGMSEGWQFAVIRHVLMAEQVYKHADQFDVIHVHMAHYHCPFARRSQTPTLTTAHTLLPQEEYWKRRIYEEYDDVPMASISDAQRRPFPQLNWQRTVYHGVPEQLYHLHPQPGHYLAFLGRIAPDKGVLDAIEIAKRAGVPLKIAGNPGILEEAYFTQIEPLFEHPLIEYVGELTDEEKDSFLGQAQALLFPIQWEEPFGIVMAEALACGTPVIAYRRGSVSEVITDGVTGWVVDTLEEAVEKVQCVTTLERARCRASFEQHFTVRQMALSYLALYDRLCMTKKGSYKSNVLSS